MQKLKIPRYIQWLLLSGICFLIIMTLLRLALVLFFKAPANQQISYFKVFFLGFRYDLRDVSIACLLLFLLGTIKPLHPLDTKAGKRIAFTIWTILIIAFCLFYAVDFANYSYLSERMRANLLNLMQDTKSSFELLWQNYPIVWMIIGLIVMIFLLLGMITLIYNIVLSKQKRATKGSRIMWGIVFFLILAFGIFGQLNQYPLRWSDAFRFENDYAANVSLNPFQSFFSSLEFRGASYDLNAVKKSYAFMSSYLGVDKPDTSTLDFTRSYIYNDSESKHLNVVVVLCESFSAYKSSMYGNPLNTTPFFKSLYDKGVFFDRCFTPSYGTPRGVWALITGIPDVDFINTSSRNPNAVDQHSIMNDFEGYDKNYFIGGSTSWANIKGLLTNNIKGIHLYEQDDYNAPKIDVWGVSDKNLFLGANKFLAEKKTPFFAVIQTSDNHRPYTIPDEDKNEFKALNMPKDSLKKYGFDNNDEYNAFRYTDFCYKKFIDAAQKETYFKNTLFVFVGDHGIRGDATNMFTQAWTDELTSEHVPLLFYCPSVLQHKEYSFLTSQVDIMPTIAGICKMKHTNTTLGKNLLSDKNLSGGSAKHNCVFIVDPDEKRIGIIHDNLYYSYGVNNSSPEKIASVVNNDKVVLNDSLRNEYKFLTEAFYQTSRYMILNNKKKVQ